MRAGHRQRRLRQGAQGRAFDGKAERARLAEMARGLACLPQTEAPAGKLSPRTAEAGSGGEARGRRLRPPADFELRRRAGGTRRRRCNEAHSPPCCDRRKTPIGDSNDLPCPTGRKGREREKAPRFFSECRVGLEGCL